MKRISIKYYVGSFFTLCSSFLLTACGIASEESFSPQTTPLTIEAIEDGKITFENYAKGPVTYQLNGGEEQIIHEGSYGVIDVAVGDKVSFLGNNPTYSTKHKSSKFRGTADYYVYGNVMSLVNATDFATLTAFDTDNGKYAFYQLFAGESHLRSHPTKAIVLPAMTLSEGCYGSMFSGCKRLKRVPELPAMALAERCYFGMFANCDSVTIAPALPAMELKSECYRAMFSFCKNIKSAPELPATTLASGCYFGMFTACASLIEAPSLPATKLESSCYYEMFKWCKNLATAPKLPATTLAGNCYESMFEGCTNLEKAPELPAPVLVTQCYKDMFNNCSKLNYVKCLAIYFGTDGSITWWNYHGWLTNVAKSGTFVKASSVSWDHIPKGWVVQNAE